jgi:uncharacterized protein YbcV (DUF1398 family)
MRCAPGVTTMTSMARYGWTHHGSRLPILLSLGHWRRGACRAGALGVLLAGALAILAAMPAVGGAATSASISTDQTDYSPGATVTLTGAGWQPAEPVQIVVNDSSGGTWSYSTNVVASPSGAFTTTFKLSTSFVASYLVTATGPLSGTATTTFSDSAASLSQCTNGGVGATPEPCRIDETFSNWVNGDSNASKSHWAEDEFIPYRTVIEGITAGEHTLIVEYDTVHSGKHALDYLGSFDATETTSATGNSLHANKSNPCLDVLTGSLAFECTPASPTSKLAIPSPELKNCATSEGTAPTPVSGFDSGRFMKIWGPLETTITSMKYVGSEVESGTGQCSRTLEIKFFVGGLASSNSVVLAWGGHIARGGGANGWGAGDGASSVNGSPYHMALVTFDKSPGSQDRALAAAAVIPASTITVVKKTVGGDGTFGYTTTGPLEGGLPTSFNITTSGGTGEKVNPDINPGTYTVNESSLPSSNWSFTSLECTTTGGATFTKSGTEAGITIPVTGGATVTCTYTNSKKAPGITTKAVSPATVGEKIHDTATLTGLVAGNGTGTVTFKLYSDSGCKTEVFKSTSSGINATGTVEVSSEEFTITATGTYFWVAEYSGDSNNLPASTKCGDSNESSVVEPAQPSISTKAVSPVTVGEPIHDTATLSGLVDPTGAGTVTFKLFSDEKCETELFNSTSVGIKANGNVESGDFTPSATGTYYWTAAFSGDKNNEPVASGCKAANESSVVEPAKPGISTKAVSPVTVGEPIHDTATLTGLVDPTGTGTVTFKLFSDEKCETELFNSTSVGIKANGNVESGEFTPSATGTYYWTAAFSGDKNNEPVASGCKAANESSVVEPAQPSISTKAVSPWTLGEPIRDTATLSGLVDPTGAGTVTFKAYADGECKTTPLFESMSGGVSANGDVVSGEFTPSATGTVFWVASYSGDKNNLPAATSCKDSGESSLVEPAKPGISTKAVSPVTVGEPVKDTATLTGLVDPTGEGTVTFRLFSDEKCETELFNSTSVGIKANGNVESDEFTPSATGTYYWTAAFSGDKNNEPVASGCKAANESSVVEPAKPAIVTKAVPPVTVGEPIHDTATLTGLVDPTGTGTVTFKLFSDEKCETEVFKSTSAGIKANGNVESDEFTPSVAGTYYWTAAFSGDKNNEPATSGCKAANESSVVEPAKPGISTKAVSPVTVGAKIHDTATLTGLVNADGTGTITFKLYSDSGCKTEVASAKSISTGVSGSGTVEKESAEFTTTATGTYFWIASYSGDKNNLPASTKCEDSGETSLVEPAQPSISTKAVSPVTVGEPIHDTATLSGLVDPTGTGTVMFKAYADSECKTAPLFESTSGGVSANGDVVSGDYTTVATGTVFWVASYSGDSNNLPAASGCKDSGESSLVEPAKPAISTKAVSPVIVGENIKDTATLAGLVNADGSGKVTFKLFSDSGCKTEVSAAKSVSTGVSGSGTVVVESGEYTTTATGTYYWVASYSGDSNNQPVSSGCKDDNESSVVNKGQPSITTSAVTPVTVGAKIHDTATLSGLIAADGTGKVTFKAYADSKCATTPLFESTNPTSGGITTNGDVPSSEYTTTAAGTVYWVASYSGDSNNLPASTKCGDENESSVVEKAQPGISTTASPSVILGESLHDTAHLTGAFNPTGTITFKLYAAGDTSCTTALKTVGTEVNKGNGDYESPSVTVGVGSYQWVAEYSGDANNITAVTSCNDPHEQTSVTEHPGISVVKEQQIAGSGAPFTSAVLSATVGQQINYRITVTNTGDVPLTLSFSDPHCDAGTITGPTGNLNPDGTLPPGGVAQYFCSHVLKATDAPQFTNAVTVTGQPPSGPPVSGASTVVTNVAQQAVAAVCSVSVGSITLHGGSGSRRRPFTVRISALGVKQITFYLDRHKLKTLTKAQAKNGQFTIRIDPRKLSYGAHTVSVKAIMSDANCANLARAAVFVHPRPPVVKPKFTG